MRSDSRDLRPERSGEEGYLLIGLVVACFLILLGLSVAAPRVAKELERDREVESEHRGLEYVRAIQLYYRRNNSYPTSVEQLLGTGTTGAVAGAGQVKYLRQAYKDPLTHGEYRLIHQQEAQTEVKGFFGEPLPGMPVGLGAGIGGTPSAASAIGGSTPGTAVNGGSSTSGSGGFSLGSTSSGSGSTATGTGMAGSTSGTGATGTTGAAGTTSGSSSSTDATTFQGSKGAVVGVGSNGSGKGLVEWNGSEDIAQWEFLYDPRVEQAKAKVSILGGTAAASGNGALGSGFAPISGTSTPGTSLTPTLGSGTGTGSTTGTGTTGTSSTPTQ